MKDTHPQTETQTLSVPKGSPEENYTAAIEPALNDLRSREAARGHP